MSKKKSIQIDERLFSVFEELHKKDGDTWNDVIAKMCGWEDYMDFIILNHLLQKSYHNTIVRCDKTIDWVDEVNKDD